MRKKDLLARHPHGGAFGSSPSSSSCSTWNFISGRTWDQCQRGFEAQLYEHSSPDFKVYLHTHPPEYTLIDTQEDFLLQCYPVENWEVFPIYDGRWLVGMKMDSLSMDLA
ncbi:hypothetical protein HMI55_003358 [Coelomomyces lativittatus]|nr:hypothetical protein HMI55_003358 [Coelomomyces lativittatus]